jgi:hypothetical protein
MSFSNIVIEPEPKELTGQLWLLAKTKRTKDFGFVRSKLCQENMKLERSTMKNTKVSFRIFRGFDSLAIRRMSPGLGGFFVACPALVK